VEKNSPPKQDSFFKKSIVLKITFKIHEKLLKITKYYEEPMRTFLKFWPSQQFSTIKFVVEFG